MMSNKDIAEAYLAGEIDIKPLDFDDIQPNSVDIHMDNEITDEYGNQLFNYYLRGMRHDITQGKKVVIPPKTFALGTSIELVALDNSIAATLHTRSSIGRMGILTHTTAGLIDAGFRGNITLELFNCTDMPVAIDTNEPVAQLTFHRLDTPTSIPYSGVYQNQIGIKTSKYYKFDTDTLASVQSAIRSLQ